jgi:hypothetical protein
MIPTGTTVIWDRPGLSRGIGVVVEVKTVEGQEVHMVRDSNSTYALAESRLTPAH